MLVITSAVMILFYVTAFFLCLKTVTGNEVPVTHVSSVSGMLTNLPCNITPSQPDDKVNLVLWYKDREGKPLFSFDLRDEIPDKEGKIWAKDNPYSEGTDKGKELLAQLNTKTSPTAVLSLMGITAEDAGTYRCRVDFKKSPTRYWKVKLDVIVPPQSSVILNEKGEVVSRTVHKDGSSEITDNLIFGQLEPFNEGSTLILTCDVMGASPKSRVSWWVNGEMIDATFEEIAPGKSRNTMKISKLSRNYSNAEFTCIGANTDDSNHQITNSVTLRLNLRPTSVDFLYDGSAMSVNQEYQLTCLAFGSQPAAIITWWIDDVMIPTQNYITKASSDAKDAGNGITNSTLTFTPTMSRDKKSLVCRAENPVLQNSIKTDEGRLHILYPPVVGLSLGSNLEASDIKEGDDVYFECNITSNPTASKVTWKKDGEELSPATHRNIIINEYSLVIQKVDRLSAGKYVCEATNSIGSGSSDEVQLNVKFAPFCSTRKLRGIYVGRRETVRVTCNVTSNPTPTHFSWKFNTTSDIIEMPRANFVEHGNFSVLTYQPQEEMEYGSLLCWGRNELGQQLRPCVFHLLPAGPPDPVSDCTITNKTYDSFFVTCLDGYNGGMPQTFVIEVHQQRYYDDFVKKYRGSSMESGSMHSSSSDANGYGYGQMYSGTTTTLGGMTPLPPSPITRLEMTQEPRFNLQNLSPGTAFTLVIYAKNEKGRSNGFVMRGFTLKKPASNNLAVREGTASHDRHSGSQIGIGLGKNGPKVVPILWIVFAITSVLILISIIIGLVIRSRRCSFHQSHAVDNRREGKNGMMRTTISMNGSNKSSGILLISDKHNISSPSLNSHSTLMGDACGGSKHGGNSSISIDHSSMTNSNKQRFVRGHSSPGIASDGMDREKNPDLIPDQDSSNTPSRHGGNNWDGSNSNHRQHLFHGSTNNSAHHHNHPLLSPQLDIGSTERTLQSVHGQNNRGLMNQQLSSAKGNTMSLQRHPHSNVEIAPYGTMTFRNNKNGTSLNNSKKRNGEQHGASNHNGCDNRNGMWRRSKTSSHNAYTTLPRKIHSSVPPNQLNVHNTSIPENSAITGRRELPSGANTMRSARDGLHLPVSSIRNQCPPLPPMRGDSSMKRNSERRFSDITYAELSLNQQNQMRGNNGHPENNLSMATSQSSNVQTSIAPLSEGVPAELRVTSPTTVYATIDHRHGHHPRLHQPLSPPPLMAGIEEIGDENDMTSLGMNGVTSPVVVQAPVPPQFADDPSVEGTNEKTCSIPLLCGTNENLNNLAKASNESECMKNSDQAPDQSMVSFLPMSATLEDDSVVNLTRF